jgi:adenine deaminase
MDLDLMDVDLTGAMDPDLAIMDLIGAPVLGGPPANIFAGKIAARLGWIDVARLKDEFVAPGIVEHHVAHLESSKVTFEE